jgi:hypothetical protein
MTSNRKSRLAVGLSVAALGALALLLMFTLRFTPGERASAAVDSSVNVSLTSTGCDTDGVATCIVSAGSTFIVTFNATGQPATGWAGYDLKVAFSGSVNYKVGSLKQTTAQDPALTLDCGYPTGETLTGTAKSDATQMGEGTLYTACASHDANDHMYLGPVAKFSLTCKDSGSGTLSLVHGDGITDLVDSTYTSHDEAVEPAVETLTITCGAGGPTNTPGPSNTPGGPTSTPTRTPGPVTPTPTRAATACGDVNGNGSINPVDALLILQLSAGLIPSLMNAASADVNHNGTINAIDATLILQEAAGIIPASGLHCS